MNEEEQNKADHLVQCEHCGMVYDKEDLRRSCSNCFACVSCEIYLCPGCKNEIVVKPMKKKW